MRVWIVFMVDVETSETVGVFSSFEKADEIRNLLLKNRRQFAGQPGIEMCELDQLADWAKMGIKE